MNLSEEFHKHLMEKFKSHDLLEKPDSIINKNPSFNKEKDFKVKVLNS